MAPPHKGDFTILFVSYLIPLGGLTILNNEILHRWTGALSSSLVINQIFMALGSVIAGITMLIIVTTINKRCAPLICGLFSLPLFLTAYIVMYALGSDIAFICAFLLQFGKVLIFTTIWVVPLLLSKEQPIKLFYLFFVVYNSGSVLSIGQLGIFDIKTWMIIEIFLILIVSFCIFFALTRFMGNIYNEKNLTDRISGFVADNAERVSTEPTAIQESKPKNPDPLKQLAKDYGLTSREVEVLQLLAEGKNASSISEILVIGSTTAKSHLRNIYAKMGIHSQNELIPILVKYK